MSKVKISTTRFDESISYLYVAHENIEAYSVVFGVNHNNIIEVYTDQKKAFDNGTPRVLGIAQNNAKLGEVVEVQNNGISKVRFFSRNIPVNTNIFLQKDSNGVCCLVNENDIEPYQNKNGKLIMMGVVLPTTQPITGSTLIPRDMIINVSIDIVTGHSISMYNHKLVTLKEGIYDYKTDYYYFDTNSNIIGPNTINLQVIVQKIGRDMYKATVMGTTYSTLQNLSYENGTYNLSGISSFDDSIWDLTAIRIEKNQIVQLSGTYKSSNGYIIPENIKAPVNAEVEVNWIRPIVP